MKTVIVYGIEHKGCTYNVINLLKKHLNINESDLTEYFLPKDMPHFCIGCNNCFAKGEEFCPHQEVITPIKNALLNADLLIFTSPVYVRHVTGQMKAFLDHFAFQFMVHRPNKEMFSKTAFIVSIGTGAGMNSTINEIKISLKWWGISKIFKFGYGINVLTWDEISNKNKLKIENKIKKVSTKIKSNINKFKIGLYTKGIFYICRYIQKKLALTFYDKEYWEKHGWLGKNRPWK